MNKEEYVAQLFGQDDDQLRRVRDKIAARGMPTVSVAPEWGKLLTMLVRMTSAHRVLEIGALGGYSGICLARGLPHSGKLVSLEINPQFATFARENLEQAGLGDLVEFRVGPALDSFAQLEEEGASFDLVFIDADKSNYPNYLEWAIKLSHSGSVVVADNTLLHGRVLDPSDERKATLAMRQFNESIASDPRLEGLIIPYRDGLAVARVK